MHPLSIGRSSLARAVRRPGTSRAPGRIGVMVAGTIGGTAFRAALALGAALFATLGSFALAQGSPSGDYGPVPLGGSVQGAIAPAGDFPTFHTYLLELPAGSGPVTIQLEGFGHDMDLALKFGTPIVNYDEVDHLDVSEEPNPSYTIPAPSAGVVYIDVLNLLPQAAQYRLSVTGSAAGSTPGSTTGTPGKPVAGGGNPLGGGTTAPAADPLTGTFDGDGLTVTVEGGSGSYRGSLALGGRSFPFEATGSGGRLDGNFSSDGQQFAFSATLNGDALTVQSGGATYRTLRTSAGPAAPANPLDSNPAGSSSSGPSAGGATPPPPANDPVLAEGPYGPLTQDNAIAFLEALQFAHEQVGMDATLTEADLSEYVLLIAQAFPTFRPDEQLALASAREVWSRIQANWQQAAQADREQFVTGMFILWYGEQQVSQWLQAAGGPSGAAAAGSTGCGDIDACFSTYASPETYADTVNAQSCWAAAGCSGYDAGSNEFTYEDPNY